MRRSLCTAIAIIALFALAEAGYPDATLRVGTNPLAYPLSLQLADNLQRYVPIAAGLEYGFNVSVGYQRNPHWAWEARLALGSVHQLAFLSQIHGGLCWFPFDRNVYGGLFCKVWDFYNTQTEVHFFNAAPYLSAGYRFDIGRFYIDTRLNQTFAVLSWSSLEHTRPGIGWFLSPWPGFIPILPTFTCTVGWSF